MCLDFAWFNGMSPEGEGWKIVKKTNVEGVYHNFYEVFQKGFGGYTVGKKADRSTSLPKLCGATYTLNQEYKVSHTRKTGSGTDRYRAGVHMWKKWETVLAHWGELSESLRSKCALVRVKYSDPVAHDMVVIVALRVTVVEEVDMRSFTG